LDIHGYYSTLGLTNDSDNIEIKKEYRKLVKKYHPDKNIDKTNNLEMIKKINIAFEVLSDINKRNDYDKLCLEFQNSEIAKDFNSDIVHFDEQIEVHKEPIDSFIKFKEQKKKSRYTIIVEDSLCMAFGSCEILAPNVFHIETNRIINPKAKVISESGNDFNDILDAAQTCPTKAIKIIDKYTGRQIFP
jgi:molecular chaperone DnaJ